MRRAALLTVLLVACSDGDIMLKEVLLGPETVINAPSEAITIVYGEALVLSGTVADGNGLPDIMTVTWASSLSGELADPEQSAPDQSGKTTISVLLEEGSHAISLTAIDSTGETATDSVSVTVEPAVLIPDVEILSPLNFSDYLSNDSIPLSGTATDPQDDPTTLTVTWTALDESTGKGIDVWSGSPSSDGSLSSEWASVPSGNWELKLTATDPEGNSAEDVVYVVVGDIGELDQDDDGYTPYDGDCNDKDAAINPGAQETCGDGIDNDCDTVTDNRDIDADGYIDEACASTYTGKLPASDCDDADADINPGQLDAPEQDYIDENCDEIDGDITNSVFDFDNDGWADIYVGASEYAGNQGLLYRQASPERFVSVPPGLGVDHFRSHGSVTADFDRDGDLDLVVGHSSSRCDDECYDTFSIRLFENQMGTDSNFIQLDLTGTDGSNHAAIGARVSVTADGVTQTRVVDGGHGHYGSQDDLVLHFGLGEACSAAVTVTWPDAAQSTETHDLGGGYRYQIEQGGSVTALQP
jgi:hypothetical protein